jgi:hypothetical protein
MVLLADGKPPKRFLDDHVSSAPCPEVERPVTLETGVRTQPRRCQEEYMADSGSSGSRTGKDSSTRTKLAGILQDNSTC